MSEHIGAITPNVLGTLFNAGVDTTRYLKQMFILYEKLLYIPQSGDTEGGHRVLAGFSGRDKAERGELRANSLFGEAIVEAEDVWARNEHWKILASMWLSNTDAMKVAADFCDQFQ